MTVAHLNIQEVNREFFNFALIVNSLNISRICPKALDKDLFNFYFWEIRKYFALLLSLRSKDIIDLRIIENHHLHTELVKHSLPQSRNILLRMNNFHLFYNCILFQNMLLPLSFASLHKGGSKWFFCSIPIFF